jgi:putative ATPase
LMATACMQACRFVGFPESRIIMSQTAIYLATSAKSNSAYLAIDAAQAEVQTSGNLPVPLHLRNAPTKLMKQMDYGKNYKYAHNYKDNFVEQAFLPSSIHGKKFYQPGQNTNEEKIKEKQDKIWKR